MEPWEVIVLALGMIIVVALTAVLPYLVSWAGAPLFFVMGSLGVQRDGKAGRIRKKQTPRPRVKAGHLSHDLPGEMRQGESATVAVEINQDHSTGRSAAPPGAAVEQTRAAQTGDVMSVWLTGETDVFRITAHGDKTQQLVPGIGAVWAFEVQPEKSGRHSIFLHTAVHLREHPTDLKPVPHSMQVEFNFVYTARKFIGKYWPYLAGSSVLTFLAEWIGIGDIASKLAV